MTDIQEERLVKLLEQTGMIESKSRCRIVAEELLASGVIVPQQILGRLVYEINYDEKEKTYAIKGNKGRIEITLFNRL